MAKSIVGILAAFFIFFMFVDLYSQVETKSLPKNNFTLFSEITLNGLDEIQDAVTVLGKEKIYKVSIGEKSEEADFLLNIIKQKFSSYNFIFDKEDGFDYRINITEIKFSVSYSEPVADNVIGNEYFVRDLKTAFEFSIQNSDNKQKSVLRTYRDKVNVEYYDYIQDINFDFMKSVMPDKPFMKKILVPVVIVAVSALTAILFFTIRSK